MIEVSKIDLEKEVDAIYIEFEAGPAGWAEELDADRIVDYSENPGKPIGVSLHNISKGVKIADLPNPQLVEGILEGIGIKTV